MTISKFIRGIIQISKRSEVEELLRQTRLLDWKYEALETEIKRLQLNVVSLGERTEHLKLRLRERMPQQARGELVMEQHRLEEGLVSEMQKLHKLQVNHQSLKDERIQIGLKLKYFQRDWQEFLIRGQRRSLLQMLANLHQSKAFNIKQLGTNHYSFLLSLYPPTEFHIVDGDEQLYVFEDDLQEAYEYGGTPRMIWVVFISLLTLAIEVVRTHKNEWVKKTIKRPIGD